MSRQRPEPVECANFDDPADYPHGAPLLWRSRLQASPRDATFVYRPDVRSDKASHVVVASHRYEVGGGIAVAASACDTARIAIDTGLRRDAAEVHSNGQCRRRGCRELFARALTAGGSVDAVNAQPDRARRVTAVPAQTGSNPTNHTPES